MLVQAANEERITGRIFQSRNPDEIVEYVGKALAPHRMYTRNPQSMRARLTTFDITPVQIIDIQYGTDVRIDPGELESVYLIHAAMSGVGQMQYGRDETAVSPENLYVTSPGKTFSCRMTPKCRHLTVKIANTAFDDYLMRVLNIAKTRPLVFYPEQQGNRELSAVWRNMLNHLISQMEFAPNLMNNINTQKQYSMVLVDMLLTNYSNSYSEQIALYGNDISPWHVRRARDIIHASIEDVLSITDIAHQVGVSVRSLQNGFRQFIGLTPVEYVRRHRLERLHRSLQHDSDDRSVTQLMLECGIVNFGRYAQYYRQQYGCRPSDTLRSRHTT